MSLDQVTELAETDKRRAGDLLGTPWYSRPGLEDPELFARQVHMVAGPAGLRTVLKLCEDPETPSEARRYVRALRDRLRVLRAQPPVHARTAANPGGASNGDSE